VEVATMFERPGGNTHGNGKCVRQDSWARKWQPRVYDRQLSTWKWQVCASDRQLDHLPTTLNKLWS
jgi:hypothetical protein